MLNEILWVFHACVFVIYVTHCYLYKSYGSFYKLAGPEGLPLIGNALQVILPRDEILKLMTEWIATYGDVVRVWSVHIRAVIVSSPAGAEKILSSTTYNEKGTPYNFIQPWLCQGLLISNGKKWHHRRKVLTPAFHFDILKQFMKTFVEQSNNMVDNMQQEVGKERTDPLLLTTKCTLNVMCETAMGTRIEKEVQKKISDYLQAIHTFGECLVYRVMRVIYHFDWTYFFTTNRLIRDDAVSKLHKFTEELIEERRVYRKQFGFNDIHVNDSMFGKKKMAMLDVLLENEKNGLIDKVGVREEVDTFMFEGHDTTSIALGFFLFRIANEEEVQSRIYEELYRIFGDDDRDLTTQDLTEMKYLECCIKESLRLYPSVPLIFRNISEDAQFGKYTIPAGTVCNVNILAIHHREDMYPEPERFIPERFLPENSTKRHQYAYLPFSAGPRNCIGQKFAMMEMKTMLSRILRRFKLEPVTRPDELVFTADLVLRTKDPFYIRLVNRPKQTSATVSS